MHKVYEITEVWEQTDDVRTLSFRGGNHLKYAEPGQFVKVWIPEIGEAPISLSGKNQITVRKVGSVTNALHELEYGDKLYIQGGQNQQGLGKGFPYGNYIGAVGGIGIAPVHFLIEEDRLDGINYGTKRAEDILFYNDICDSIDDPIFITEDGSFGHRGLITEWIKDNGESNYAACGPIGMINELAKYIDPKRLWTALEELMGCGTGLCGKCYTGASELTKDLKPGKRVCVNGPVFNYKDIMKKV